MRLLYVFLLLATSIFASEIDSDLNLETNVPELASEAEPIAVVAGSVNAVSGAFFYQETDLITPTIEPLSLTRSYDSEGEVQGSIGYGVGLQYPLLATDCQKGTKNSYAYVNAREGQHMLLQSPNKNSYGDDHRRGFHVDSRVRKKGCSSLTGKGNPINFKGILRHRTNKALEGTLPWELSTGDGTKRSYKYGFEAEGDQAIKLRVQKGKCYLLSEEIKPNGNRLKFTYDYIYDIPYIKSLETFNRKGKLINRIDTQKLGADLYYHTPTGDFVNYVTKSFEYRKDHSTLFSRNLSFIGPSQTGQSTVSYFKPSEKKPAKAYAVHKQGGFEQVVDYDHKGRVKSLTHTVGPLGKKVKTHRFNYGDQITYVKDALGHKVNYIYDDEKRVTKIVQHDGKKWYRADEFIYGWGKRDNGWLLEKHVSTPEGLCYTKKYTYDKQGNVIKETVSDGNGNSYATHFEYTKDGFNSLARIIRPEGLEQHFSYLPETNLKTKELELLNGSIHRRKFIAYDDNAQVQETIEDDGSGFDPEDLSDVTYRRVQRVFAVEKEGVSFGKPERIEALAFQNNQPILLNATEYTYDDKGNTTETRVFDSTGKLQTLTTKVYDPRHRVIASTDANGVTTLFEYDHQNNKTLEVCNESGISIKYDYDVSNHLIGTTTTYPDGDVRKTYIEYDIMGKKIAETDAFGNTTHYQYDIFDNVSEVIAPETEGPIGLGKVQTTYNILGQVISDTDANGNTTRYERNIFGEITKKTLPDGTQETLSYTPGGHLESVHYADGSKTTYERDGSGRPLTKSFFDIEGTLLSQETCVYKGEHLIRKTDLSGLTTHYTYDGAGRLAAVTTGDKTTFYEKDDFGRDIKIVTDNRVHRTEYDPTGKVIAEIDEDLEGRVFSKTTYRYDLFGNKTHVITQIDDESESIQTTVYNPDHTIKSTTDAMGFTTYTTYDRHHINALGQQVLKVTTTDPKGRVSHTTYDALGRVKSEELYDSKLIFKAEKVFDAAGNLLEEVVFNPKAKSTYTITRAYDENSRLIALTEEHEKTTRNAYDCRGRLVVKTLPDGTEIYTTFDALDRPIEKKSSDGTLHTRLTYNLKGNVIKTEDLISHTTTGATYDIYNRLITETLPDGITLCYDYDTLDRITKLTLPDDSAIEYFYDPYHLRVVRRHLEKNSYEITFDAYNLRGQVLKRTTPAGKTHFAYDTLGRLTARYSQHYSISCDAYDETSNLIQETENDLAKTYSYDAQDNLTSEEGVLSNTFCYDALGNCIVENDAPRTHNHLNQLTQTANETLTYDSNGRLVSRPEHTYRYDALGKLLACTTPDENYTFTYTAGPRLLKFTHNDKSTSLLYQGDHEIGSLENNTLTHLKIIDPTHPESTLAIESSGTPYFTQQDARGNITILEDPHGNLIESYSYSAFTEESTTATPLSPWRFANRRTLSTLSLFTYRLYDPNLRRWLTPDP
ncbi:MAG: hypothetical protein KDK62_07530, partial [Chlamydiia bacterium]|nr:hypothetical protein [Chlamydiia bacterium]